MSHAERCPVCCGSGKIKDNNCHGCLGKGWIEVSDTHASGCTCYLKGKTTANISCPVHGPIYA